MNTYTHPVINIKYCYAPIIMNLHIAYSIIYHILNRWHFFIIQQLSSLKKYPFRPRSMKLIQMNQSY